ncbi:MAG: flagellar basal body L-ring protein FlgH, partial [Parvularculaceae bacterium]|nr:flagellar basal body L-ring protein FlgH [Parvularculaceae bacterium]
MVNPPKFSAPGPSSEQAMTTSAYRADRASLQDVESPAAETAGSLWRSGPQSLFGDRRARKVGDIVTVL